MFALKIRFLLSSQHTQLLRQRCNEEAGAAVAGDYKVYAF